MRLLRRACPPTLLVDATLRVCRSPCMMLCSKTCALVVPSEFVEVGRQGTGYITCGSCGGVGAAQAATAVNATSAEPCKPERSAALVGSAGASSSERCACCSGTGRVMCIGCLCTGKKVAREHDIRLDPFY